MLCGKLLLGQVVCGCIDRVLYDIPAVLNILQTQLESSACDEGWALQGLSSRACGGIVMQQTSILASAVSKADMSMQYPPWIA